MEEMIVENVQEEQEILEVEFPYCVRIRPGMYLPNITHMVTEIVDNSLDEFVGGYATGIAVYIQDDIVTVLDDGRGIPVSLNKNNVSQVESAATKLHSGGKFNIVENEAGGYTKTNTGVKTTGLHGVGLAVVNALSEWMTITVKKGGCKYQISFERGIKVQELMIIEEGLDPNDTGTEVAFKPDIEIWKEQVIDINAIDDRLKNLAYLNPGLLDYLYVSKGEEVILEKTYQSEDGMKELIEQKVNGKEKLFDSLVFNGSYDGVDVYASLAYTDSFDDEMIYSYCNNATTSNGGDHVIGLRDGVKKTIDEAIANLGVKTKFTSADIGEGLIGIVSVKVLDPNFDGQGKEKLAMIEVRRAVRHVIEEQFKEFLDFNPNIAKALANKVDLASKGRIAAQKAKEAARKLKENNKNIINVATGKFANCRSKNPEECEIYIVEGDSAGGNAKQGRNREIQAILPVDGKIMNARKKRFHEVVKSEKLMILSKTLGVSIKEDCKPEDCKYHKIILLSDADVDGAHIKVLWTTHIYMNLRPLIEAGYLYYSLPPLYKVVVGKETFYAKDDAMKEELIAKYGKRVTNIQRFKGLGEMNSDQLWETTMNPETRTLVQITIDDIEKDEYMLNLCMGEDVAPRKEFLMQHSVDTE